MNHLLRRMRADLANLAQPPVTLPPDVPVEVLPDACAPAYRINTEELPLKYQADIRWLRERANDIPLCTAICIPFYTTFSSNS